MSSAVCILLYYRGWNHHQSASPALPWWYPCLVAGPWLCWQYWYHLPPTNGHQQGRRILHDLSRFLHQVHMEDWPRVQCPLQVRLSLSLSLFISPPLSPLSLPLPLFSSPVHVSPASFFWFGCEPQWSSYNAIILNHFPLLQIQSTSQNHRGSGELVRTSHCHESCTWWVLHSTHNVTYTCTSKCT